MVGGVLGASGKLSDETPVCDAEGIVQPASVFRLARGPLQDVLTVAIEVVGQHVALPGSELGVGQPADVVEAVLAVIGWAVEKLWRSVFVDNNLQVVEMSDLIMATKGREDEDRQRLFGDEDDEKNEQESPDGRSGEPNEPFLQGR